MAIQGKAATPAFSDYQWLVAYATIIVLFLVAIKSRFGYVTIYYMLVLLAFSLTLLNYKYLGNLLAPLSSVPS